MNLDQSQEVHLSHYANVVLKRWRVILVILATVMIAALLGGYFTKPLYRSKVVLQIEREDSNRITVDDIFRIEPSSQEFLQTQYALLKSRGMAERVVRDLDLANDPELNPEGTEGKSERDVRGIESRIAAGIAGGIEIKPILYTSLVEIWYTSTSPRLAQKIANGIGDSYIQMTIARKYESVRQASTFLTAEISQLKTEVEAGERELQKFTTQKDIVSLEGSGNLIFEKLNVVNSAYNSAQSARMEREATYNSLLGSSSSSLQGADNVVIQGLRSDLLRLEREYEQKLSRLKPEHPEMVRLQEQITGSRSNLTRAIQQAASGVREDARKDYAAALHREQTMKRALDEQKQKAMELNLNAVDYLTLKSTIDNKRNLLNELTRQLNETEVSARLKGSNSSNIHFVERAQLPSGRFNATTRKNLKNALPLGLILGLAAVFFLEYMDRSLKSPEDVEKTTGFASLGIIPAAASGRGYGYGYGAYGYLRSRLGGSREEGREEIDVDLIPHNDPRSPISEAYRAFRTSLLLASARSPKVIVITSSLPREGKSTTAVNLATTLAQMGKKIVVIDADLRKPRIKKIFRGRDHAGLVNFLAARVPIEDIVQESPIPNLWYIESGPIPPNPSELLASDRMKELIGITRDRFDFVVLDSPPVMAVADSVILGAIADGVVLCIHGGHTVREMVQRAAQRLRQSNIPVLGALLNNLDLRNHGYRFSRQYYEYYYEEPSRDRKRTARAS